MKRLIIVLVFGLGLSGVSLGQAQSHEKALKEAKAEATAAASRALDATERERAAWNRADQNPSNGPAERDAQRASDAAREAGKAAYDAGARLDRIQKGKDN